VVGGDPIKEGQRRLAIEKLRRIAQELAKDFLGGVARGFVIAKQEEAPPVNGRAEALIEICHAFACVHFQHPASLTLEPGGK
jgi:hypothetical protein